MADGGLLFKRLQLGAWRQFASIDIEFHPSLTVLTGVNGVGKSTLLNIIARQLGVDRPYLAVPRRGSDGKFIYWSGLWSGISRLSQWVSRIFTSWKPKSEYQLGEITYSDGSTAQLQIPENVGVLYQLSIVNQKPVIGIPITSHGTLPVYQKLPHLLFSGIDPAEAFQAFMQQSNLRFMGSSDASNSLLFQIKNAVASWAIFGEGNKILPANPLQQSAFTGFVDVLRKVLPDSLGFIELSVRPPDLVFVTKSGEFLIDAASGGLTTLIELSALIYGCSISQGIGDRQFVVTIDEPENHLHPSLQRSLLSKLVQAFPQVQFIVATHSPFIVSSLKDSNVYVLRYESALESPSLEPTEASRVISEKLDFANRAGTASEILRDILGVPSTMPEWVENELDRIMRKYQTEPLNENMLVKLKDELKSAGLVELYSQAVAGLAHSP
jgi:energy-coupling factor transporter ATP-binding protein EcfA2